MLITYIKSKDIIEKISLHTLKIYNKKIIIQKNISTLFINKKHICKEKTNKLILHTNKKLISEFKTNYFLIKSKK